MRWPWTRRRTEIEESLLAILYLNPYGLQAAELHKTSGYPLHRVRSTLWRLNKQGRAMPLELETGVRVWMGILPEDGDQ